MKVENTSIVITGAGSGIGAALAEQLAAMGANLALVDLRTDRLEPLAEKLKQSNNIITLHSVDVSDAEAMKVMAEQVLLQHQHIDIVINNAGVTLWGYFEDNQLDDFQWLFNINFFGVIHGCKFFLPHLKSRPQAKIFNISSMFGWTAVASQSAYCASKFAVRGFSEALYTELEPTNVGVMLVHPGGVNTNLMNDSRAASSEFRRFFSSMMERSQSADTVARKIIKGIKKDKFRIRTGPEAYITEWIKRLSPVWGQKLIGRVLKKSMGV
ncbi:MAG: acetoin dehydrogenase [Cellvibrionales bacterium]|nr:acetoin dehydrogenase [Cellvibrionales bacterium]